MGVAWGGGPYLTVVTLIPLGKKKSNLYFSLSARSYCKVNAGVEVDAHSFHSPLARCRSRSRTQSPSCSFTHQTHIFPLRLHPAHAPQSSKLATYGCPGRAHAPSLHFMQLHDPHPTAGTHARKFNGGRTLIVGTVFDVTVGRGFTVPVSTPQLPNSKGDSLSRWDLIGYLRAGKNNRSILFPSALSIADPIAAEYR